MAIDKSDSYTYKISPIKNASPKEEDLKIFDIFDKNKQFYTHEEHTLSKILNSKHEDVSVDKTKSNRLM